MIQVESPFSTLSWNSYSEMLNLLRSSSPCVRALATPCAWRCTSSRVHSDFDSRKEGHYTLPAQYLDGAEHCQAKTGGP